MSAPDRRAVRVVEDLRALGLSVGTAESLTGGLVCAALTSVPGASTVVRGGVVAYSSEVKADLLGVDRDLLAREGAVSGGVAHQLADGIRRVLACDVGLSTTGVAGPDASEGKPVGTVFVGAGGPWGILVEQHVLTGDRAGIRRATVAAVLDLVARGLENLRDGVGGAGYRGPDDRRTTQVDEGKEAR